jgi:D-glycero-D-manno-heptose 1,7-bisphosphate phosphatase
VTGRWSDSSDRGPLVFTPEGTGGALRGRPAAFLDRDGTLNEAVPDPESGLAESPLSLADVRLRPGAATAVGRLTDAGYAPVCVSNQPAAAKGKVTLRELLSVHEQVIELLAAEGVQLAASLLCPHHPDGVLGELSGACACRKPAPGMLLDAAAVLDLDLESSWMLGDTDTDIAAGHAAGCRAVLLEYPPSAHKRSGASTEELRATDLEDAATRLLDWPAR